MWGRQNILGHHPCARWTRSGDAVRSLLKQQLWGQKKKLSVTVPAGFRAMGVAAVMWDTGCQ